MALAVVRIALGKIPLGHAVIGQQQFFRAPMCLPMCANAVCNGGDVAGVIVVGADKTQCG